MVTLHTLCKNVIDHPNDDRYRLVKATSRTMTQKVLCCVGGEQFLYAAGWTKVTVNYEGYYRCEDTAHCIELLRIAEDVLRKDTTGAIPPLTPRRRSDARRMSFQRICGCAATRRRGTSV